MPIDEGVLLAHRRYEDPETGIAEEFLQPRLAGVDTVAVLATHVGTAPRDAGFVVCHSFGMEQIHLSRFDAAVARALAAAGFPTLRFHAQGYGDSAASLERATFRGQVDAARDAVRVLCERADVASVGTVGARVGGTVAALTAAAEHLPLLAAFDPVVKGSQFVRDLLRSQLLHEMLRDGGGAEEQAERGKQLRDALREQRSIDIKGFPLTLEAHDELSAVDLVKDVAGFDGAALLVSVSRGDRPSTSVTKLAARLRELGAEVREELVQDHTAGQLGQHHHNNLPGGIKVDLQFGMTREVARRTAAWAAQAAPAGEASE